MVWICGAAVSLCIIAVTGLLFLLAVRGLSHFWPSAVVHAGYEFAGSHSMLLGELVERETVAAELLPDQGIGDGDDDNAHSRSLLKLGNRDFFESDYVWVVDQFLTRQSYPPEAVVIERLEWGNVYGFLRSISRDGNVLAEVDQDHDAAWQMLNRAMQDTRTLRARIQHIEVDQMSDINYHLEKLRLEERRNRLDRDNATTDDSAIADRRGELTRRFNYLQQDLTKLKQQAQRYTISVQLSDGENVELPLAVVVRIFQPNAMSTMEKTKLYMSRLWEFLSESPREANTEGGVFPAIFGTVLMVILMSLIVTPFGVIAAVYLHEYAHQGWLTHTVRVAVNNLAGVPSIVYGVFGLGFFVYFIGGELDRLFYPEVLPHPTFGTPGLLWASLTLALLTLPVVIISTEEGIARIPLSLREGSLALGATNAETLLRVILPAASPAVMTGIILAVARAAGEVAPLMLVGVVKLAPTLPVDGNFPYLHLEQKFMHLGFHIYDIGFQSPNVEAARPLVYATALLLVVIIALLNFTAVILRNRLRERYRTLEN